MTIYGYTVCHMAIYGYNYICVSDMLICANVIMYCTHIQRFPTLRNAGCDRGTGQDWIDYWTGLDRLLDRTAGKVSVSAGSPVSAAPLPGS